MVPTFISRKYTLLDRRSFRPLLFTWFAPFHIPFHIGYCVDLLHFGQIKWVRAMTRFKGHGGCVGFSGIFQIQSDRRWVRVPLALFILPLPDVEICHMYAHGQQCSITLNRCMTVFIFAHFNNESNMNIHFHSPLTLPSSLPLIPLALLCAESLPHLTIMPQQWITGLWFFFLCFNLKFKKQNKKTFIFTVKVLRWLWVVEETLNL